jgi:hypothetical protein
MMSGLPDPVQFPRVARWSVKPIANRMLIKIMKAKASIFKYGVHVPRNDREAEASPERERWKAGRTLEWLRLQKCGAFDGNWTKDKIVQAFPGFRLSSIGHVFFIYDYKYTGEHRVRLVFDGSRQSPDTFGETFSPTVRADTIRLFHLYCVEYAYDLGQYDVPQAFLTAIRL